MKKRALIFYISRFSGHYHAARSIEKALADLDPETETRLVNAFSYTNPVLGKIITKTYLEVIKKKPLFWGDIYDNPEVLERVKKVRQIFYNQNMPKIEKLIKSYAPDVVYCTQAYPCGMIADYKKAFNSDVPLVGVLTDHAPHSYWLFDEVNFYVTPSVDSAEILISKGVPKEKMKVYGIPIDGKFEKEWDKEEVRRKYGFVDSRPTVLIMGGTQGLGAIANIVDMLVSDNTHDYQLLVVTGKNKRLYRKLRRKYKHMKDSPVRLFPYVENIEELMDVSDIVITKAGGITTAEALAKRLPLLIIDPIPGQERMNADYLVQQGAALEVNDFNEIPEAIGRLFSSGDLLEKMRVEAARLSKPDSALRIAQLIDGGA